MGHIGLTPQSVHAMGGFKVQGKERRRRARAGRRRRGAGGRRLLRDRARGRARRGRPHGHRRRSPCRRSASAPGRTATARCSCSTTCSASRTASLPKFVRRYADAEGRRRRGARRVRRPTCARAASRPTTRATTSPTTCADGSLQLYGRRHRVGLRQRQAAHATALSHPRVMMSTHGALHLRYAARFQSRPCSDRAGPRSPGPQGGDDSLMRAYELMVIFDGDVDDAAVEAGRSPDRRTGRRPSGGEIRHDRSLGSASVRLRDQPQARGLLRGVRDRGRGRRPRRSRAPAPPRGRRRPPQADPPARPARPPDAACSGEAPRPTAG